MMGRIKLGAFDGRFCERLVAHSCGLSIGEAQATRTPSLINSSSIKFTSPVDKNIAKNSKMNLIHNNMQRNF